MHHWTGIALFQVIAFRLFDPKPLQRRPHTFFAYSKEWCELDVDIIAFLRVVAAFLSIYTEFPAVDIIWELMNK